jgi:hypothetical protein
MATCAQLFNRRLEGRRATCTIGPSLDPRSGSAWLGRSQKVRLREGRAFGLVIRTRRTARAHEKAPDALAGARPRGRSMPPMAAVIDHAAGSSRARPLRTISVGTTAGREVGRDPPPCPRLQHRASHVTSIAKTAVSTSRVSIVGIGSIGETWHAADPDVAPAGQSLLESVTPWGDR